jgi:hypothetical protein
MEAFILIYGFLPEQQFPCMAGLGPFGQKNVIAATTPISTAFKFRIRHRKKWAPESAAGR